MPNTRSKQPKNRQSKLIFNPIDADDIAPRASRKPRVTIQTRLSSYLNTDTGPKGSSPLGSSQVNRRVSPDYSIGEPETSGDEILFTEPHRTTNTTKRKRDEFIVPDDEVEDDSSEEDIAAPSRKKRSSPTIAMKNSSKPRESRKVVIISDSSSESEDSEKQDEEEDEEEEGQGAESDDTEEENDAPVKRRRSIKQTFIDEKEELLEELEDLRDDSPPPVDSASKSRKAAAQRRDTLDEMRKARLGDTQQGSFDPEEYNLDDEDDDNQYPNELDASDDGFIETDDDDEPIPQLPLKFSSLAAASAEDFFEDILRWMVHLILRDVVLDEDIYQLAHDKIQRQCGQWGESFRSSVWRPEFIKAMLARPEMHIRILTLGGPLGAQCDGCSRSDTYSTAEVWFTGNPYDPYTLQEVEQTSDEPIVDRHGNELAGSEFCLGKTCFHNTVIAHPLGHWKYNLKRLVAKALERELRHFEIIKRESWTEEKRAEHADDVTDRILNSGDGADLWNEFKASVSRAWDDRSTR